jgi:hypothetical protein
MPPAKQRYTYKKQHSKSSSSARQEPCATVGTSEHFGAVARRQLFAHLAWLVDYGPVLAVEASAAGETVEQLETNFASTYTLRQMQRETAEGQRTRAAHSSRIREASTHLARTANVLYVPFSQAMKAIVFLCACVAKPVWAAERKARRVVSREYAVEMLREMSRCRPEPAFEVADPELIASIAYDQTYAKAAGKTGISSYSAVQTVDAQGKAVDRERMTYINGQHFPVPDAAISLSAADRALLARVGPYTQDFVRVLPLLDPRRLDAVMDGFVERAVGLLHGQPPQSTISALQALLSRPNADPGGPTYLTYMPPLLDTDTKSYTDKIKIVEWCEAWIGLIPLILHLIGDGQSVLRLRDLKRKFPSQYKHVVVGNGHMHSGAHSSFADVFLWWCALLCMCMQTIGKVERAADGSLRGTVLPTIKSLEHNSAEHVLQGLLPVAVAIIVFFTTKVTSPPPALFLADPVLYMSLIENAGGIILAQFLRHSGLPTLFWQRGTRAMEAQTLDDLHCLALHKFRCAHKTSSSQISLLHLLSIYCTHPKLRRYLQLRLFVSPIGTVGGSIAADKNVENQNEFQKERNVGQSLLTSIFFTVLLQPMHHVYRTWKYATGTDRAVDSAVRASMVHEVDALVRLFEQKLGTDLRTFTTHNPFWYTGNPVDMRAGPNLKYGRPWEWIWRVAAGTSSGHMAGGRMEAWAHWVRRHIRDHMFHQ